MRQVYVGPAEEPTTGKKRKRAASPLPSLRDTIGYPASIVGAVLIGMLAVLVTRWARHMLLGGSLIGEDADIMMAIDGGVALAFGLVMKWLFRLSGKLQETARTVGILAMIGVMHNLVHILPGAFEMAFSPEWVTAVIESTEPQSILFRGESFVLGGGAEQAPAMPVILQME